MKRWKHNFPLMHDPFNHKWVKLVEHVEDIRISRATIDDIMSAFGIDRALAKRCYETGNSPRSAGILSRARVREERSNDEGARE